MTRADVKRLVYIPLTEERRFLVFAMDGESGKLTLKHDIDLPAQPWQLCISPDLRFLYQQVRDDGYSGVLSFRIDPETGGVTQIGEVEVESDACYVSTDKTGHFLYAGSDHSGRITPRIELTQTACFTPSTSTNLACGPHGCSP